MTEHCKGTLQNAWRFRKKGKKAAVAGKEKKRRGSVTCISGLSMRCELLQSVLGHTHLGIELTVECVVRTHLALPHFSLPYLKHYILFPLNLTAVSSNNKPIFCLTAASSSFAILGAGSWGTLCFCGISSSGTLGTR